MSRILPNFDEIFSGFLRTFRRYQGATKEVLRRYSGIGTSSAGRCIWPIHPLLASSSARPAGRSPRRLRQLRNCPGRHVRNARPNALLLVPRLEDREVQAVEIPEPDLSAESPPTGGWCQMKQASIFFILLVTYFSKICQH